MAPYRPATPATRATTVGLIGLLHLIAIVAVIGGGGPREVARRISAIEVRFVAPSPKPVEAVVPRVPVPALRTPQLTVPEMPVIVTLAPPVAAPSPQPQTGPAITADASPPLSRSAAATADQPPRFDLAYLRNPPPPYPPLSRRMKEEGRVVLRVRVDPKGEVEEVEIAASSGHPRLDQAALAAVRHWRFSPARSGERTVPGWALVPVTFQLEA